MQTDGSTLADAAIYVSFHLTSFDANIPASRVEVSFAADGERTLVNGPACWRCAFHTVARTGGAIDAEAAFLLQEGYEPCGNAAVSFEFSNWSADNYVLMPAAVYNGNRFRAIAAKYPPFLHDGDGIGPQMPVTITDVPRLNDGEGLSEIHLRSGDLSTPAVGVWMPASKQGFLLLFDPVTAFGYTGVRLRESDDRKTATLTIEAPAVRQSKYTMADTQAPSDDLGAAFLPGDAVTLNFRILLFGCPDIPALFDAFAAHRKDLCGSQTLAHSLPLSAAYRIIERKYNESQFNEAFGYYMLSPDGEGSRFGDWQAGWCGGGLSSLALAYDGSRLSRERANRTMDAVFGVLQHHSGFILPIFSGGKAFGDDFCHPERTGVLLVRKDADVLVFAARHILLLRRRGEGRACLCGQAHPSAAAAWRRRPRSLA